MKTLLIILYIFTIPQILSQENENQIVDRITVTQEEETGKITVEKHPLTSEEKEKLESIENQFKQKFNQYEEQRKDRLKKREILKYGTIAFFILLTVGIFWFIKKKK